MKPTNSSDWYYCLLTLVIDNPMCSDYAYLFWHIWLIAWWWCFIASVITSHHPAILMSTFHGLGKFIFQVPIIKSLQASNWTVNVCMHVACCLHCFWHFWLPRYQLKTSCVPYMIDLLLNLIPFIKKMWFHLNKLYNIVLLCVYKHLVNSVSVVVPFAQTTDLIVQ